MMVAEAVKPNPKADLMMQALLQGAITQLPMIKRAAMEGFEKQTDEELIDFLSKIRIEVSLIQWGEEALRGLASQNVTPETTGDNKIAVTGDSAR